MNSSIQVELIETHDNELGAVLNHLQTFFPILQLYGASPDSCFQLKESGPRPSDDKVFIKYSPLLDPLQYLTGNYETHYIDIRGNLARFVNPSTCPPEFTKLSSIHNSSYIDTFFCYLSSQLSRTHGFVHCVQFYSSCLGILEDFKFNVGEDWDYLQKDNFFREQYGKLYTDGEGCVLPWYDQGNSSKKYKQPLQIDFEFDSMTMLEEGEMDELNHVSNVVYASKGTPMELVEWTDDNVECDEPSVTIDVYRNEGIDEDGDDEGENDEEEGENDEEEDGDDEEEDENDEEEGENDEEEGENDEEEGENDEDDEEEGENDEEEDGDDEEEDGDDEEGDEKIIIHIKQFPTQLIAMEKCNGTIDELFEQGLLDCDTAASMLFQIVMTLVMFQNVFQMTHNDLHTNNIVFVDTDIEYLYYEYKGKYYQVPTYGRIYKIIDFGRSIYTFENRIFCSDSFAEDGDARTQYNDYPFFDESKPRLVPNRSFDLCRLACSIYDFVFDSPKPSRKRMDAFQRIIYTWCLDDSGKNVLYKSNGEERYPNFKLYIMIAKYVNRHVPENYLSDELFASFVCTAAPTNVPVMRVPGPV